jgi:hypothetical protein
MSWHRSARRPCQVDLLNRGRFDHLKPKDTILVHRGQCATAPVGLSWTLDPQVAASFSLGHRGILHAHPAGLHGHVRKRDIAGYFDDREESEVLVFHPEAVEIESAFPFVDKRLSSNWRKTVKVLDERFPDTKSAQERRALITAEAA